MKLAFAGTPAFAEAALHALASAGHHIALVLTQPDRPAGRGQKLQASPVKQLALARGWPLCQPRSLRLDGRYADDAAQARAALEGAAPELMVVAAYGLILPQWVLDLPRLGCLNIHASLLPRWRGAAPIQRAIEAGDARTGITLMQMDAGLDTGGALRMQALPIGPQDTSASLHQRLAELGAQMTVSALDELAAQGGLPATPQADQGVSYAAKIDKAEARIDWREPAQVIERRCRAFDPFPGCHFELDAQVIKLWSAEVVQARGEPGEILAASADRRVVACGRDALSLRVVQRPGGRRQDAAQALTGPGWAPGHLLASST